MIDSILIMLFSIIMLAAEFGNEQPMHEIVRVIMTVVIIISSITKFYMTVKKKENTEIVSGIVLVLLCAIIALHLM